MPHQVRRRPEEPARKRPRRCAHRSVAEFNAAFICTQSRKPKSCKRAGFADETAASIKRLRLKTNEPGLGEEV